MRSQHEPQVFSAAIKNLIMQGDILCETSNNYLITKTSLIPDLSWDNLRIPEISIYGMSLIGFPHLRKETYDNWIFINSQPSFLTPLMTNSQVNLISKEDLKKLENRTDHLWSTIYTLTRPGFSQDFLQALIQITGYCAAIPCSYGNLLYLESTGEQWQVKSSYGLYNQ
ncbi:hypothetical protein N0Y54_21655 [Nostoc punctiforme UO1]|uniref:hypothetical protein n=1 Tax=Nostoc punctiforme TaxID=272131 RepID=UPI00309A9AF2